MRITFVTRKFGNVERNLHCDVLHITPIRVARLFLDCNGDFAIKDRKLLHPTMSVLTWVIAMLCPSYLMLLVNVHHSVNDDHNGYFGVMDHMSGSSAFLFFWSRRWFTQTHPLWIVPSRFYLSFYFPAQSLCSGSIHAGPQTSGISSTLIQDLKMLELLMLRVARITDVQIISLRGADLCSFFAVPHSGIKLGLCLGGKGQWICCVTRGGWREGVGREGERREGREGMGGEGGRGEGGRGEGRDDCYTYSNGTTIFK